MKTCTYQEVLNLAAELAGRTRGKLPTQEALMLRAFFAAELPDLWNKEAWPELCDHILSVRLDENQCFSTRLKITASPAYPDREINVPDHQLRDGDPIDVADLEGIPDGTYYARFFDADNIYLYDTRAHALDLNNTQGVQSATSEAAGTATIVMGDILSVIAGGDPRSNTRVTPLARDRIVLLNDRCNIVDYCNTFLWVEWQEPAPDLLAIADAALAAAVIPFRFKMMLAFKGAEHLLRADGDLPGSGAMHGLAEAEMQKQCTRVTKPWWRRDSRQ